MITCDDDGGILVDIDGRSYCLSDAEQYSEFLLWVTSPDPGVDIADVNFKVDDGVSGERRECAQRYADFLIDFAKARRERLSSKSEGCSYEQLQSKIEALIQSLQPLESQ